MLSRKRQEMILDILNRKKHVTTSYLAEKLYCSVSTIRRELIKLEERNLVERFHGGVSLIPQTNLELPRVLREKRAVQEKRHIADLANIFIGDGFAMFLDASSTVNMLSHTLRNYSNLTIVTNGLKTALDLSMLSGIDVFFAGGEIKQSSNATVGEFSNDFLNNFKMNLAFISCRGIDQNGIYEANHAQASVKQQMIKNSEKTILLCDDSKFDKSHFYKLTTFDNIDAVITNQKPPKALKRTVENAGSEVIW